MKKNRTIAILYLTCAILCAISVLINTFTSNISICAVNTGLSCVFICLGILYLRRGKDNSKQR